MFCKWAMYTEVGNLCKLRDDLCVDPWDNTCSSYDDDEADEWACFKTTNTMENPQCEKHS